MVRYSAEQDELATAETPTDGFTSVDAHFGWRPMLARSGFEFAVVGHNLTDTVQRNAVALNKDEVVLPGRDIAWWRASRSDADHVVRALRGGARTTFQSRQSEETRV